MTVAYVDTSSLVAIAFEEAGGAEMATLLGHAESLVSSNLLEAELRATFLREQIGNGEEERLEALLARMSWILPDQALSEEMRQVARHGYVRGADLWHLACALFLSGDSRDLVFATFDLRQREIAKSLGFEVAPLPAERSD